MKSIKKSGLIFTAFSMQAIFAINSAESVCHRCEEIREYNAEHHENFEYYDDYLTSKNEKPTAKAQSEIKNNTSRTKE